MTRITACPTCKKSVVFAPENLFRPFCSERCQQIDLGAWIDESYRVPSDLESPSEDELYEAERRSSENQED